MSPVEEAVWGLTSESVPPEVFILRLDSVQASVWRVYTALGQGPEWPCMILRSRFLHVSSVHIYWWWRVYSVSAEFINSPRS